MMMFRKIVVFLYLISLSVDSFCQKAFPQIDHMIDSAKKVVNVDSSNLLFTKALAQSEAANYQDGVAQAILYQAVNFYNSNDFVKTLKWLDKWEAVIYKTENSFRISHYLALKGSCYGGLFYFDKSNQYLKEALIYADKIKDNDEHYSSLGRIYIIMGTNLELDSKRKNNPDSVLFYKKKSYLMQRKIIGGGSNKVGLIIQTIAVGNQFLEMGREDSAKHYLQIGLGLAKQYNFEKFAAESYISLGSIQYKRKNYDSALVYFNKLHAVASETKNGLLVKDSYELLSKTYEQLGRQIESVLYLKKYKAISDSLARKNKLESTIPADMLLDEQDKQHNSKERNYIFIIACSICLLILAIVIIRLLIYRQSRMLKIHNGRLEEMQIKLESAQNPTLKEPIDENALNAVILLAMNNDPAFLIKFKEIDGHFIEKLMTIQPAFVTSDLIMCAQLRLGFYTKEIARYMKISVRAVENRKYRIRKKLDISSNEDINVWMLNL